MKVIYLISTLNGYLAKVVCPNEYWINTDNKCHPTESSYTLNCLAAHFELTFSKPLFNFEHNVQIGGCNKTINYDHRDYTVISMRYDERSNSGELCYVSKPKQNFVYSLYFRAQYMEINGSTIKRGHLLSLCTIQTQNKEKKGHLYLTNVLRFQFTALYPIE